MKRIILLLFYIFIYINTIYSQSINELDKLNGFKSFKLGSDYKLHSSRLKFIDLDKGVKNYNFNKPELIEFQNKKPTAASFGYYNAKLYDIMMFFDDYEGMSYNRIIKELTILFGEPTENRKTLVGSTWICWVGKKVSLMTQYFPDGNSFCIEFQSKTIKRMILNKNISEPKPKDATFYYNRAVEEEKENDNIAAIADFTKAIEINPNYYTAYLERGTAKGNLKDHRGAILDYNKAIKIDPKKFKAYFNRGLSKIILGQKEDGCLDLSKAGELGYDVAYEVIKKYC